MKKTLFVTLLALASCMQLSAQTLYGILHNNRYDDGEQMKSTYVGYSEGKAIFVVDQGIYRMSTGGSVLTPEKDPVVAPAEFYSNGQITDKERALWATNFNLMYGNSGAAYVNGKLVTVMSRDEQSTTDEELFAVRKWDAETGNLLSSEIRPKSDHLESAGMSYNPKDGKVYGLFYLTGQQLPSEITSDPDYFQDQDDDLTDGDAGYCLCTVDLSTMTVTPVTRGLYYYNFITFAINSEGRAFALTSGGSAAPVGDDGKQRDVNGNLVGAQLWEFDLTTGLIKTNAVEKTDAETGETYTDYEPLVGATGFSSQYKRQAACFAKSNPNKMYWVGYYNSGKGYNEWGSWGSLPDKEWKTNKKYDTCLYEVDITTGEATRVAEIQNRCIFSCLWVDGDDCSDDATVDPVTPGGDEPVNGNYIALQTSDGGSIWQRVEMGQQYTYFLEAAEGWKIHSVTFNGSELTVASDNTVTTPAISTQYSRLIATFEKSTPATAIQATPATPSAARILGSAEGIHVTNANPGDQVSVYTIDGRLVRSQRLTGTSTDITLKPDALYVIRVADKVVKVRL